MDYVFFANKFISSLVFEKKRIGINYAMDWVRALFADWVSESIDIFDTLF